MKHAVIVKLLECNEEIMTQLFLLAAYLGFRMRATPMVKVFHSIMKRSIKKKVIHILNFDSSLTSYEAITVYL